MPWNLPGEVNDRTVTIFMTGAVCTQPAQLLQSTHATRVIQNYIDELRRRHSEQLGIFEGLDVEGDVDTPSPAAEMLAKTLSLLTDMTADDLCVRAPDCAPLVRDQLALSDLVIDLYNHWRGYERYMIFEGSADDSRDSSVDGHTPFIYNNQDLTLLVREAYRRLKRNLKGQWPRVYHQTPGGANMSLLVEKIKWNCPGGLYEQLKDIRMVRLAILTSPVVLYPRANKRRGKFIEVDEHPLRGVTLDTDRWFCMPVRVGELNFHVYFDREYLSLGVSLTNLFELSGHDEARAKPDGMLVFGIPAEQMGPDEAVFHIDDANDIALGAIVKSPDVDYFGYFKKMMLTLHNMVMMRRGRLPLHGAMVRLKLKNGPEEGIIVVGDSGAGKSETLEAFRELADEWISDMTVIFDDMGSLLIDGDRILGYGTEIGAFLRLDDLAPGYALGRFDRSIFMNPQAHNARVVLPITPYAHVVAGSPVSMILYANNYEPVTDETPVLEFLRRPADSLRVFGEGIRAAKGTTDEKGLVRTYFANPFGPDQRRDLHEPLAERYFTAAHDLGITVGQLRTRLGIEGMEREGPRQAAEALFEYLTRSGRR